MPTPSSRRPRDWLLTARQTIPRLRSVLSELEPTFHLDDVRSIDADFLSRHGIQGLIWDVDGTLTNYHAMDIADVLRRHVEGLFASTNLRHAILSNCDERRFEELKIIFRDIPLIRAYRSDNGLVYRTALAQQDSHSEAQITALLAEGAQQIRKPSRELIEHATNVLNLAPDKCVMIGDQYFTDVASANLAGIRSIKVKTFGKKTFPRSLQTTQRLELVIFRLLNGKPRR